MKRTLTQFSEDLLSCTACPRLTAFARETKHKHPSYHCKPVPSFGDADPRLLIIGLAPGRHGAGATGRPFTGDAAGVWLYRALYEIGFASAPESTSADDGLVLRGALITNAVRCVPPANKPTGEETTRCGCWLRRELAALHNLQVVLVLGAIAHRAYIRTLANVRQVDFPFAHGARHQPPGPTLLDSYHSSRLNTNTGRLTWDMFIAVFQQARKLASRQR